eukprot:403362699
MNSSKDSLNLQQNSLQNTLFSDQQSSNDVNKEKPMQLQQDLTNQQEPHLQPFEDQNQFNDQQSLDISSCNMMQQEQNDQNHSADLLNLNLQDDQCLYNQGLDVINEIQRQQNLQFQPILPNVLQETDINQQNFRVQEQQARYNEFTPTLQINQNQSNGNQQQQDFDDIIIQNDFTSELENLDCSKKSKQKKRELSDNRNSNQSQQLQVTYIPDQNAPKLQIPSISKENNKILSIIPNLQELNETNSLLQQEAHPKKKKKKSSNKTRTIKVFDKTKEDKKLKLNQISTLSNYNCLSAFGGQYQNEMSQANSYFGPTIDLNNFAGNNRDSSISFLDNNSLMSYQYQNTSNVNNEIMQNKGIVPTYNCTNSKYDQANNNALSCFDTLKLPSAQEFLIQSAKILQNSTNLNQHLERNLIPIRNLIKDTQRLTQEVTKYIKNKQYELERAQTDEYKQRVEQEINDNIMLNHSKIQNYNQQIQFYKSQLDKLFNKNACDKPRREIKILTDAYLVHGFTQTYDKMLCQLSSNMFVMQNTLRQSTDVVSINPSQNGSMLEKVPILPLNYLVKHSLMHSNRILLDTKVYDSNLNLIQTMEDNDVISSCALNDTYLCVGHSHNGYMSLWRWNGIQYEVIQKSSVLSIKNDKSVDIGIQQIKSSVKITGNHNEIYFVVDNGEMWRLKMTTTDLQQSDRVRLFMRKSDRVIDFELVSEKRLVILFKSHVMIMDPNTKTRLSHKNLLQDQSLLLLTPRFDADLNPIIFTKNCRSLIVTDIHNHSHAASAINRIQGFDDFNVLGQIDTEDSIDNVDKMILIAQPREDQGQLYLMELSIN